MCDSASLMPKSVLIVAFSSLMLNAALTSASEAPPFARVTNQPPAMLEADSYGAAWGDYDNDGLIDLFVANMNSFDDHLYRNLGNGSFEFQTNSPIVHDGIYSYAGSWADYDGDGDLDLLVTTTNENEYLYENDGSGGFTLNTTSEITMHGGYSLGSSWADYDGDGWLDLAIANAYSGLNFLFKSQENGDHLRILDAPVGTDSSFSQSASWVDFDNDDDMDLLITGSPTYLYRNDGASGFTNLINNPIANSPGISSSGAWGDYDNDGDFDLFLSVFGGNNNLYENVGVGGFSQIMSGNIVSDGGNSVGASWGDYDNDGWLDLVVADRGGNNSLYRNLGDGTFEKISEGSVVEDGGFSNSSIWADYDNDGDLDLFVSNGSGGNGAFQDFLYENTSEGNNWVQVKVSGDAPNTFGVGAIVYCSAEIGGELITQQRQIGAGDGFGNTALIAHFGLGSASTAQIRVKWPDGHSSLGQTVLANSGLLVREMDQAELVNTSFEEDLSGWNLEGSIERVGPPSQNPTGTDGNYSASIGTFDVPNSSISQEILLVEPGQYSLVFDWLANGLATPGLTGIVEASVTVAGSEETVASNSYTNISGDFNLNGSMGFLQDSLNFQIANSNTTIRISFTDASPEGGDDVDVVVDNIRLFGPSSVLAVVPDGGEFIESQEVSLVTTAESGDVHYTTDGSEPTLASPIYTAPFTITETTTVQARLYINGFVASDIITAEFTEVTPPEILFDPPSGLFTNSVAVSINNQLETGTVRYTLDGTDPTSASTAYSGPLVLTEAEEIRAQVFFGGFVISDVYTATYARVYAFEDDGIPFAWREQYFGSGFLTDPNAAAHADPDGDFYTNLEEFENETIPTDGASAPEIELGIQVVPKLTFTTVPGKTYRILRKDTLDAVEWEVVEPSILATGTTIVYVDADAPPYSYYQIELVTE